METSLSWFFDLYVFPTGRRLFALAQVMKKAMATGHADLAQHCATAVAEDRKCLALERRWAGVAAEARGKGTAAAPPKTLDPAKIDPLVDRTLGAIRDHAETQRAGASPEDPIHATVSTLLKSIFPSGVADVTRLPWVEELAAVEDILSKLASPALAPVVTDLGLSRLVERLESLTVQYRAALHAPAPDSLMFGEVRAARAEGQERLLQIVAIVLGKHHQSTPADIAARVDLLGPVMEQNDAIGASLKGRNAIEDVNPETGEADPGTVVSGPSTPVEAPKNG